MVSLELEARLNNLLTTSLAETANIDLFASLEKEECPICMIPMPFDESEVLFMTCCGKYVCHGCSYKRTIIDMKKKNGVRWHIIKTSIEHLTVAASAGNKVSMDKLMKMYKKNALSKEDLTQTLRSFQTSSNEMKSKDRDDARAFLEMLPAHLPSRVAVKGFREYNL